MSRLLTALCIAIQHSLAGAAVVIGIVLSFLLPIWTMLVYLDGRYMNPKLAFWMYLVTVLPAMVGILVIYVIVRCYWTDMKKGAPKER